MNETDEKKISKKYKLMNTSKLIDEFDDCDDEYIDLICDELDTRSFFSYLQDQITENRKHIDEMQMELRKDVNSLSERLDKIDNFWNISNKLEMILDRMQKKPYKSRRKNI